jgi:hypothetical protein
MAEAYEETDMTTAAPRRKASRKPLRIRQELLPDSAKYGTFDGREYLMIPVEDFGGWYEDIEDRLALEEARNDPSPGISLEELLEKANRRRGAER